VKGLCVGGDELPHIKVYFVMRLTDKRRRRIPLQNENSPSLSAFYNGFNVELNLNETHLHSSFWVIPRSLNLMCRCFGTLCPMVIGGVGVFVEEKGFGSKIFLTVSTRLFSCLHRLWRWNRVFRNVGTQTSDAGESPKRKDTAFRTRRKI